MSNDTTEALRKQIQELEDRINFIEFALLQKKLIEPKKEAECH